MWNSSSWMDKKVNPYNITYGNGKQTTARAILHKISRLPPLVTPLEILHLRNLLKEVALGQRFIWQCGDCAELFDHCETSYISDRIRLLSQLGLIFTLVTGIPAVRIGRMAGQYGKPRNGLTELVGGVEIHKFHGDVINTVEPFRREPEPERMLSAYFHAGCTMNYIRALASGNRTGEDPRATSDLFKDETFAEIRSDLVRARQLLHNRDQLMNPVFTSHECLFLHYEQAFTRPWSGQADATTAPGGVYNASAHFLWVGDKTRQLDGAHLEYIRGLQNPVGIKIGPTTNADELVNILDLIDPHHEPGKVVLITRLGRAKVSRLDSLIQAVQGSRHRVIWQCDPMHGNTRVTDRGIRTRDLSSMIDEVTATIESHRRHNSWLGGIHVETTPDDDVMECVGGVNGPQDKDIGGPGYKTKCDPRLNSKQAMELALVVGKLYAQLYGNNRIPRARL
ncbi:phospho-2-dehydro-3-deoxyheptonate aldolase [Aspergillus terreus]|uniref:Phospho-2-dehydro-3-deoxyheptonate aldolase n=1 Tax=Aspergillus terreus TaxID=33178 RepID=A0A5M3Z3W6_ASPTE|nr:hypothetical protein ATETN484_0007000300 [Aspergillus terreus]GFF19344.1 phospho-2-dehydro-3-deoxyheptonate aldolase [Aspergillus terreus]